MDRILGGALFALLCIIWGSTWLVIKVGYGGLGPFNVAALRFLIAGALLVPIGLALRVRWPQGREWGLVAWVGTVLFAIDYGLIYWAEQWLESGLTAVLFAVLPVVTAIFAHFYLKAEPLAPRKVAGTLIAFAGVGALFADKLSFDAALLVPMLAIVASAICAATASVATKRHGSALHPAALNAPAMLIGGVLLLGVAAATGETIGLPRTGLGWGAVLYLAIAGSIVTFLIYFRLLKEWSATSLSFVSVFTPLVALGLGLLVDEPLTPWMAVGTVLILLGVLLALTRPAAPVAPDGPPPIVEPER